MNYLPQCTQFEVNINLIFIRKIHNKALKGTKLLVALTVLAYKGK